MKHAIIAAAGAAVLALAGCGSGQAPAALLRKCDAAFLQQRYAQRLGQVERILGAQADPGSVKRLAAEAKAATALLKSLGCPSPLPDFTYKGSVVHTH
jgi:hypothetical protein